MKIFLQMCVIATVLLSLSSCTFLQQEKAVKNACATSSYVYGDLEKPESHQTYYLPSGQTCPKVGG